MNIISSHLKSWKTVDYVWRMVKILQKESQLNAKQKTCIVFGKKTALKPLKPNSIHKN